MKTFTCKSKIILLMMAFILYAFSNAYSQSKNIFFTELANGYDRLNSKSQQDKLQKLQKNKLYKSIKLISVGDFKTHQEKGVFAFSIPGTSEMYAARASQVKKTSIDDFSWYGLIENYDSGGYVTIISKKGEIGGHINVGDRFYEIFTLGEGICAWAEVDNKVIEKSICTTTELKADNIERDNDESVSAERHVSCTGRVRILYLHTANAENAVPDIDVTAQLSTVQLNGAFHNSNIFSNNVQVNAVGPFLVSFNESGDIGNDVTALTADATIQALRDTHGADLVVLLTDGNYTSGTWTIYGQAAALGPNNANAYAIVEADQATASYTFAHEVGHLYGGMHQQCSVFFNDGCDDRPGQAHGYGFTYGLFGSNKRNTIMHQIRPGYTLVPYFSNPAVSISGNSTGVSGQNNNAGHISSVTATVAGFRSSNGTLEASFDTQPQYPLKQYSIEAVAICGQAPFTYTWEISTDGMNFLPLGNTETITVNANNCDMMYLTLTINSSDGQVAVAPFMLPSMGDNCGGVSKQQGLKFLADYSDVKEAKNFEIVAYPNPSPTSITAAFSLDQDSKALYTIFDFKGKPVQSFNENLQKGTHKRPITMKNLPNGLYYLQVQLGDRIIVKRIAIEI